MIDLAATIDRLRVIPRAVMALYLWVFYRTTEWFLALPEPTGPQSAFASAVIAAGGIWFGVYVNGKPTKHGPEFNIK